MTPKRIAMAGYIANLIIINQHYMNLGTPQNDFTTDLRDAVKDYFKEEEKPDETRPQQQHLQGQAGTDTSRG